jgi:guanyl-specific ribonuclease Sa
MADYQGQQGRGRPWRPQGWTRVVLILVVLAVGSYLTWQKQRNERRPPERDEAPPATKVGRPAVDATEQPEVPTAATSPEAPPAASKDTPKSRTTIPNQTIRDLEGNVAYRGEIDVGPTIERIRAGRLLDFPNDGTTFQNRERRLPRKPAGYYKEYVHPTPRLRGPGPQRIVAGEDGEFYYTPDHYRTFRRVE